MQNYFAEIGLGNDTLISTEIESEISEYRLDKLIIKRVVGVYFRIWVGWKVVVVGLPFEFKVVEKNKRAFKLLFGIHSV